MFKDDRMMSMLTFVLVMLVVGTMIQRADVMSRIFGEGPEKLELRRDEVIARANELTIIDVLENDAGVGPGDRDRLLVVKQPACGRVFVRDGKAQYLPAERCAGPQSFRYSISGYDGPTGEVIAVVQLDDPAQSKVVADAQRDLHTPTPGTIRPDMPQASADPSVLAEQSESAATVRAAPTVPRPQAGQAAGLAPPVGVPAQRGDTGLALGAAGSAPRIAAPEGALDPGTALPESAALPTAPLQPSGPDRARPPSAPPPAGSGASAPPPQIAAAEDVPGSDATVAVQRPEERLAAQPGHSAPAAIDPASAADQAGGEPIAALQPLMQGTGPAPAGLPPIDISPPPTLADPVSGGAATPDSPQPLSGKAPATRPVVPATTPPAASAAPSAEPPAPTPSAPAQPCSIPPALTLDIRPGGRTVVSIDAPCDADHMAQLSYDTLEFGIALDNAGKGSLTVPGLQPSSDAELRLPSGDGLAFDLPFADTDRIDRVAMVWRAPVQLDLHAFEFGAPPGSDGHVSPDRPRSFEQVRRRGGGYLLSYAPVGRVGQHISVYTWWRRPGSGTGVVKLKVGFASRAGGRQPEACGSGALAHPDFRVLRSHAGHVSPPGRRRLAPLDCTNVAAADRLIGDAVDDMVILRR